MKTFNYIVAVYFGNRRSKMYSREVQSDSFIFVKEHFKFIANNLESITGLSKVYFVCNLDDKEKQLSEVESWFEETIASYGLEGIVNVIYRENKNFSYGAWNEALIQSIQSDTESDYAFLIEDDYVPCTAEFHLPFISKIEEDIKYGFVACLAKRHSSKVYKQKLHAAISNGLIRYSSVRQAYETHNSPLSLKGPKKPKGAYGIGEYLQVHFLSHITENFTMTDISAEYSIPFYDIKKGVKFYGRKGGKVLINPIRVKEIRSNNK